MPRILILDKILALGRLLLLGSMTVSLVGCVDLEKPKLVAECATQGPCINKVAVDGGRDSRPSSDDGATIPVDAMADALAATDDGPETVTEPDSGERFDAVADSSVDAPAGNCVVAGEPSPAGTVCRVAAGPCDVAEVCDGVGADCPVDKLAGAGIECRAAAGDCDIAETCTGFAATCPADTFAPAGKLCRALAGACDVAESCTGTNAACPIDSLAPAATVCRVSTDNNQCDPAEMCSGSGVSCPADVAYTRPATPTGLSATGGNLQATLAWTASARATGYNVKRSVTNGSGYTTLGNSPTTVASPYLDTGLTGSTTYYYVVSSINTIASCESVNSAQVSVVPVGNCTPPTIPTATATAGNGQVVLTWTASAGATSYAIARSVTSGTGYTTVQVVSTGTSYSDANVVNGTTYYYVITASNGSCSSRNSLEVSAAPKCTPPAPPTALVATPSNGSVALTWTAPAGAVSYRILRSTSAGAAYVLVGTSSTASYTDTTVANGTVYFYVVTAGNSLCNSANSAEVSAAPACMPPSVPTGITTTPSNGQVALSWVASTGGATLYRVLRGTVAGGPYTSIATPTGTGYTDTGVSNGTTYYYVINASNGSCASANSAEVSAKPVCTPPPVPTGLAATPGDSQVGLTWSASTGATSFTVSRSTVSGGAYASVATASVSSYTNIGLTNGTNYYFVVSASNGACSSANSAEVSATPAFVCTQAAPTGLVATAGNKQVSLSWTAAAGAASYGIARSTTTGTGYTSVGSVTAPATTFADTDATLVNGTTYYYVVNASSSCTSANSTQASAKPVCTPPAAPSGITAVNDAGNGHITVTWATSTGATAYTVSRNTAATGTFTAVSTNQTAASFTDTSALTAGNTYYYVVSASNAGGSCASGNSSPAVSAMSCTLPAVPIGLTATVGTSGQVALTWTASGGATSYTILRSTSSGGTYTSVGTATTTSFANTGLANDTTYYYVIAARNGTSGNCSSANSSPPVVATPRACQVLPSATNAITLETTGSYCFVTCYDFAAGSWTCSNFDARTINVNGSTVACAAAPPAKSNGAYTFNISAGTYSFAHINWWGTPHDCPP